MAVSLGVVAAQAFGIVTTIRRSQERKNLHADPGAATVKPSLVAATATPGQIGMARRRFLTVTGATLLGGVVVSGTAGYLLGRSQGANASQVQTEVLPNTPVPAQNPAQNPAQPGPLQNNFGTNQGDGDFSGGSEERRGKFRQGNNSGATNGNGSAPPNNAAQPTTPAAQSTTQPPASSATQAGNTQAASTTQAPGASGTNSRTLSLGSLSNLAVGAALEFTTPDTNEPAFVIHEKDGSIKAFSGLWTHRPYKLVYDAGQQELVCNLHGVPFNIMTGAPTRSPARSPLSTYKVHVDAQNNIIYDIA
jgi:nitrite reductase/ring-hydroxylating ferredoxin subunit